MMTNHNANPICNSKGDPNPINPTNPNTRYRYEYGTLNSMFAQVALKCSCPRVKICFSFFCLKVTVTQQLFHLRNGAFRLGLS